MRRRCGGPCGNNGWAPPPHPSLWPFDDLAGFGLDPRAPFIAVPDAVPVGAGAGFAAEDAIGAGALPSAHITP